MPRITLKKCLAAAAAATVLAVPPAFAQPASQGVRTSSLAGTVSPHQDLRGERAKDIAASPARRAVERSEARFSSDPWPTPSARSIHPYAPAASSPATAPDDGIEAWLAVTLGLAALGAAGGAAGIAHRRHATA
jgi:hypothetical protein